MSCWLMTISSSVHSGNIFFQGMEKSLCPDVHQAVFLKMGGSVLYIISSLCRNQDPYWESRLETSQQEPSTQHFRKHERSNTLFHSSQNL